MERNRSMAAPSHRKKALPAFYQPAERGSSAAKIMAEARRSLRVPATQRPSTPADTHRALFGKSRTSSRPPSVFRCTKYPAASRELVKSLQIFCVSCAVLELVISQRAGPPLHSDWTSWITSPASHTHTNQLRSAVLELHSHKYTVYLSL